MRVCAVVVTYNRPELLKRCVAAVLEQTLAPTRIIVVDNASEPAANVSLGRLPSSLEIHRFTANTGGAGGFHYGLTHAFREKFDAAWLMDDDGVPAANCLEALVRGVEIGGLGFAAPLVVDERQNDRLAFGIALRRAKRLDLWTVAEARGACGADGIIADVANPFNGTLVTEATYRSIGDIKFECFIWGDEEEYLRRALESGTRVGTCTTAIQYHPAERSRFVTLGPWQSRLRVCPTDRSHHYYRNLGHRTAEYGGAAAVVYLATTYALYLLWKGSLSELRRFFGYYLDGVFDRYRLEPSRTELKIRLTKISRTVRPTESALDS